MSDSAAVDAARLHSQHQASNLLVCANNCQDLLVLAAAVPAAVVATDPPPLPQVKEKKLQVLQPGH